MTTSAFERFYFKRRKWYIQPCDCMSSEKINELFKNAETLSPKQTTGCPDNNAWRLRRVDRKEIKTLMEETSLGALKAEGTDFGINFFVYVREWNEDCARFCSATTKEMREKNGKGHKDRFGKIGAHLTVISSEKFQGEKRPTFTLKREETPTRDYPPKAPDETVPENSEKESFQRRKCQTPYRISTNQTSAIRLLEEELKKAGADTKPIPRLRVRNGIDNVWEVPPSVVLVMKIRAKKQFLRFGIWKRDKVKEEYTQIERFPPWIAAMDGK
ncbi:MAG: hypothetical protein WC878_04390 [Candidatus Paceibacterota bacterium]|jgi:hypothetical protein